jgi:hypothetical protein
LGNREKWKKNPPPSKIAWTVHSPHQIQLEKKNLPSNLSPPPPLPPKLKRKKTKAS